MTSTGCRNCGAALTQTFADLGMSPLANAYPSRGASRRVESFFPLHAFVCERCLLVQLEEIESPEVIFSDYAYLSSSSRSWLEHCRDFAQTIVKQLDLGPDSRVVEIASNDGYLLQYFLEHGIQVLGIEPARNVARIAWERGIPTRSDFFGAALAKELAADAKADLIVANNVLAHVPDLHDFVEGMHILLHEQGTITIEFPHLLNLISRLEFDTIYHEHFSYFSLRVVQEVLASHNLSVIDVEELPTHGGSLRVHAAHSDGSRSSKSSRVEDLLRREDHEGLRSLKTYLDFDAKVRAAKRRLLTDLISYQDNGESIVGYGAPAKATTLFNYCGIDTDFVSFTVDANPVKQERFIPGTNVPILAPDAINADRPDLVWILPWNLTEEIMTASGFIKEWGGRFLVCDPSMREIP